ncbi:hypothetical protein Pelo_8162 [Pelomyxa schiedti]|nr:hypothetical protein Pelo_8162 [Pelomyxa schiedti]
MSTTTRSDASWCVRCCGSEQQPKNQSVTQTQSLGGRGRGKPSLLSLQPRLLSDSTPHGNQLRIPGPQPPHFLPPLSHSPHVEAENQSPQFLPPSGLVPELQLDPGSPCLSEDIPEMASCSPTLFLAHEQSNPSPVDEFSELLKEAPCTLNESLDPITPAPAILSQNPQVRIIDFIPTLLSALGKRGEDTNITDIRLSVLCKKMSCDPEIISFLGSNEGRDNAAALFNAIASVLYDQSSETPDILVRGTVALNNLPLPDRNENTLHMLEHVLAAVVNQLNSLSWCYSLLPPLIQKYKQQQQVQNSESHASATSVDPL